MYKCPFPGCTNKSETADVCQRHGQAKVVMQAVKSIAGSRYNPNIKYRFQAVKPWGTA